MKTIKTVAVQIVLSGLVLSWISLQAAVLHVPGDYGHIQNAIDAGTNGDVILVSPGVYNENINFRGKAVTVTSTNTADPNVVKSTIIHASGQSSVVSFVSGENSNSVLAGFTITGGYGTSNPDLGAYFGGGIYCLGSSPTIIGNIIVSNAAPPGGTSPVGYGGGIACIQSDAIVTRNLVAANTAYAGGGLANYRGNARFTSNLICSNSAAAFAGGAGMISGGRFINNTFLGNAAPDAGNLYANSDGRGQCLVAENIICKAAGGGGLHIDGQVLLTQARFNDVWNNIGGNYIGVQDLTGIDHNISGDPQFVDVTNSDLHLLDVSPCINAGDRTVQPLAGEVDYYGNPRLYAGSVDLGAVEYFDNFRPVAEAGPDRLDTVTALPALLTLDGSASTDPNGAALSYHWSQFSGPAVTLSNASAAKPSFDAAVLGLYVFQLVVSNATFGSFPDIVQIRVINAPPIAAAVSEVYSPGTTAITLDGSLSSDPEGMPLSYRWTQVSGWNVQLSDSHAVNPAFTTPWPGSYVFQLMVNDGIQDSLPATVRITVGSNHPPVANAGPSLYVLTDSVALDGTGSYDPDGYNNLTYAWRQVSGPSVTMAGTNTATPMVSGFRPSAVIQKCVFELVVSDGGLTSAPSPVTITIVPNYGANALYLENPLFDPTRPTIVAFGGGDCSTGSGLSFGGVWDSRANWITVPAYGTAYNAYGDMLMVYLSSVAPNYQQPIQAIGFSTGNKPAMRAAWHVNSTYKDARYAVNRVSLCDATCNNLSSMVASFQANPVAGEQCWVDNYISNNDPAHLASYIAGALNVTCNPPRAHVYPINTYTSSSLDYQNGGLTAFGYLSVIGSGRNYQLNTSTNKYYFAINSSNAIVFANQSAYPGKILAPVQLAGPKDGSALSITGAVFSCQPVENAVRYQLLFGADHGRVMDFSSISDSTNPPNQLVTSLPAAHTWWTVKAFDQFGSTIYADPRLIKRPENQPPIAQAGLDQVRYAGLAGTAAVTLNGANSSDPDGDPLTYTWAWVAGGTACVTNGVSPTVSLPPGVYSVQLMVNDGQVDSQPAQFTVTVLQPLTASLGQANGTIALSWGALTGTKYQVQYTTNLPSGPWLNLGGILTATGTTVSASDNIGPAPQRFYRVVASP